MPTYAYTDLDNLVHNMSPGTVDSSVRRFLHNEAVRHVFSEHDLRAAKRKAALSPNLFPSVYDYSAPSDLKDRAIVDIKKQVNRSIGEKWRLVTEEEFDRKKEFDKLMIALADNDFTRVLRLDAPERSNAISITNFDSLTDNGTWTASADAQNITLDTENYINGGASLNFDTDTGAATAVIENSTITDVDLSDHDEKSSLFLWMYFPVVTDVTNIILRWGNDSSNYWSRTVTTNNAGNSFHIGWNLLRFDWNGATETGTVDPEAIDYARITITKDAGVAADTDWRVDKLVSIVGSIYDVVYYTKLGWQNSSGTYIENSTADTDKLNVDTEEFRLITLKSRQIFLEKLDKYNEARRIEQEYELAGQRYKTIYPSERIRYSRKYYQRI